MLAKVNSAAVVGLEGQLVEVEVDISNGLPSTTIVGLPDTAVQESRERVRSAIRNAGCTFPTKRITINMAPADLKKAGPAYDLDLPLFIVPSLMLELSSSMVQRPLEREAGTPGNYEAVSDCIVFSIVR